MARLIILSPPSEKPLQIQNRTAHPVKGSAFSAWQLILSGDAALFAIVRLSLVVRLSAVALAALTAWERGSGPERQAG